jgi:hypothetical protein
LELLEVTAAGISAFWTVPEILDRTPPEAALNGGA